MKIIAPQGGPSASPYLIDPDTPVPYAFERLQRDSDGGEVDRLEAQNLQFEKMAPLDHLPHLPLDATVLDLGSGTGFWSQRLAARVPRGRIVCLDRSPDLLALAAKRLEGETARVEILHQDLRRLDLPSGAFDLVFTSVTLTHVMELDAVLDRIVAALKPGGWIACYEPVQQSRRFCEVHPPCPNLEFLMDRLLEVVEERGSDLSVGLKIAQKLDALGMADTVLRNFGCAVHGEDARICLQEVFLPLAQAYLRHRWERELLERRCRAGAQEASTRNLWLDMRRAVVLARKPGRFGQVEDGDARPFGSGLLPGHARGQEGPAEDQAIAP